MKPVVIGITGKACAGKNQYAKAFEELGARLIDVDRLGHQALEANKDRIIAEFGDSVADRGEIDRKALGAIVFPILQSSKRWKGSVTMDWLGLNGFSLKKRRKSLF